MGSFLDLQIRYYSAGMLMRLAFSIVTSCDPQILLLDEFFSAGDMAFRMKAHDRMWQFMNRARIVVMAGHDLPFLEEFCDRVLWLEQGTIRQVGPAKEVIAAYSNTACSKPKAAA